MATKSSKGLKLRVTFDGNKYNVEVPADSSVGNLMRTLAPMTGIPQAGQRLIYKGKSLSDASRPLTFYKIKTGAKIMMLGQKADPQRDATALALGQAQDKVDAAAANLAAATAEVDGIDQGFLPDEEVRQKALKKLKMTVLGVCEELMRGMEQMDAMQISREDEVLRSKRKNVVRNTEALLTKADAQTERITALMG